MNKKELSQYIIRTSTIEEVNKLKIFLDKVPEPETKDNFFKGMWYWYVENDGSLTGVSGYGEPKAIIERTKKPLVYFENIILEEKKSTPPDCSRHKKNIAGISDMKQLAEMIGDLHYKTLSELLEHLGSKLILDAAKDRSGGRKKLAKTLENAAMFTEEASIEIEKAYDISKPFMKEDNNNLPVDNTNVCEKIIQYIENDAEILIPSERFFNEDGSHITKKKYGLILLEILCQELREHFCKPNVQSQSESN